jgi:hypothetical protein
MVATWADVIRRDVLEKRTGFLVATCCRAAPPKRLLSFVIRLMQHCDYRNSAAKSPTLAEWYL